MDLTCASRSDVWMILSSEGCPMLPKFQNITKCPALAGIIFGPHFRPKAVVHLSILFLKEMEESQAFLAVKSLYLLQINQQLCVILADLYSFD